MMSFFQDIYPWLISAVGGALGAMLLLVPRWGENFLLRRENRRLEEFKSDNARQLEYVREKLGQFSDRGRRSNEMEFKAIEIVWRAFVKAWLSTNTCLVERISYPDFKKMNDDEVRQFAVLTGWKSDEQKLLIESSDREKEFLSLLRWNRTNVAAKDIFEVRLVLREQRIFMQSELTEKFILVIDKMSEAQVERRLSIQNPSISAYRFGPMQTEWTSASVSLFEDLASMSNRRLFRNEEG